MNHLPVNFTFVTEDEKAKILTALRDPRYLWRTAEGVAKDTDLPVEKVRQIMLEMSDEVVIPRAFTPSGAQLYGSREHILKNTTTLGTTISGVFKNRIF